jgi:hypothetical protein
MGPLRFSLGVAEKKHGLPVCVVDHRPFIFDASLLTGWLLDGTSETRVMCFQPSSFTGLFFLVNVFELEY